MPSGVYYRKEKDEYIVEVRNALKRFKINREAMEHILSMFERMTIRQVRLELRLLENPEAYQRPWRIF